MIALHCSGSGAAQWRKLGEALGSRHAFVVPEHYGCDSTGAWSGERAFTLADEAARTIGIIDASRGKAAWFNFGPEADVRIRRVWQKAS